MHGQALARGKTGSSLSILWALPVLSVCTDGHLREVSLEGIVTSAAFPVRYCPSSPVCHCEPVLRLAWQSVPPPRHPERAKASRRIFAPTHCTAKKECEDPSTSLPLVATLRMTKLFILSKRKSKKKQPLIFRFVIRKTKGYFCSLLLSNIIGYLAF